ncbi:MAG: YraN family protein [Saprospiraceae bacterium]
MAKHLLLGRKGEQMALDFLLAKGYQLLERNWRFSRAEVDLILKDGEILVFVEVKTRSYDFYGQPEESITPKKEGLIADAAAVYMESIGHEWEIRFDIISIILNEQKNKSVLEHYEDAFFPSI